MHTYLQEHDIHLHILSERFRCIYLDFGSWLIHLLDMGFFFLSFLSLRQCLLCNHAGLDLCIQPSLTLNVKPLGRRHTSPCLSKHFLKNKKEIKANIEKHYQV